MVQSKSASVAILGWFKSPEQCSENSLQSNDNSANLRAVRRRRDAAISHEAGVCNGVTGFEGFFDIDRAELVCMMFFDANPDSPIGSSP